MRDTIEVKDETDIFIKLEILRCTIERPKEIRLKKHKSLILAFKQIDK